jgi:hypothetical protein
MGYKRSSSTICDTISKLSGETVRAMAIVQSGGEHGTTVPCSRSSASSKAEVEAVLSFLADAGLCTHGHGLGINFDPYQVRSSLGLWGWARGGEGPLFAGTPLPFAMLSSKRKGGQRDSRVFRYIASIS